MRRLFLAVCLVAGGVWIPLAAGAADASAPLGLSGFKHIVVDDATGRVFLSSDNGLQVRDSSGAPVANSLNLGQVDGLVLSADGTTLYAAQPSQDSIAKIDTATLTQTSSIATGSMTEPRSLSMLGSTVWFAYSGTGGWTGGVGAVDTSAPTPTAVPASPATVPTVGNPSSYYYAPLLASSPAYPDTLFVAPASSSPSTVSAFTISGTSLAKNAVTPADAPIGWIRDMRVSADGSKLLLADGQDQVLEYSTADLSPVGAVVTATSTRFADPVALAQAPDGSLAVGLANTEQPLAYVFAPDGSFRYQYGGGSDTMISADAGLAYNATGTVLYSVAGTASGAPYELHVFNNLTDTARPPAPVFTSATPDFRAVGVTWVENGRFPYDDATIYTVYRGTSPTALSPLATVKGPYPAPTSAALPSQSYVDKAVTAGVTYYYAVTASNTAGASDLSPVESAVRDEAAFVFAPYDFAQNATDHTTTDIAYESDHGPLHTVTSVPDHYTDPAVSPDGSKVAYSLTSGTAAHLGLINLDGTGVKSLTSGTAKDTQPAWSPDGSTLAFTRTTSTGSSIWTVPASGGTATHIPGTGGFSDPSWSPDGTQLAVGSGQALKVLNLVDGYARTLVTVASPGSVRSPSFSPDGKSLLYVSATPTPSAAIPGTTPGALMSVPTAGGKPTTLTNHYWVQSAKWSPDGSRAVFSDETGELWALTAAQVYSTPADNASSGPFPTATSVPSAPAPHWRASTRFAVFAPRAAYTAPAAPAKVSAFSVTGIANGTVSLSWTRPAGAAYVVVRRSAPGAAAPASRTAGAAVYAGTAASATASRLENGSAYRFSVFAVSAAGVASPAVSAAAAPAAIPKVSPNGSVLGALVNSGPSFNAAWGPVLAAGQTYQVQLGQRVLHKATNTWSAPVFSPWLPSTRATHATVNAAAGNTYYVRARIRDSFGHVTAWSASAVAPVPYDDRAFTVGSGWSRNKAAGTFASTLTTSLRGGARASTSVTASSVSLVADMCSKCGGFHVLVDGNMRGTFGTYSPTLKHRQLVWSYKFAGIRKHKVTVVAVGTRGHPQVRIDGLRAVR